MQAPGQSRYVKRPTDVNLLAVLNTYAFLTKQGSNTAATVDTTVANGTKLNIRASASAAFTQITVTSSATAAKTQLISDLNAAFLANNLGIVARISGTNQITLDTTAKGPNAYLEISAASPSTAAFHTVVGLATTALNGLTVAALKTAVYPTGTTINVSSGTITALSTFTLMASTPQTALVNAIADVVAPSFVETGSCLQSLANGVISKLVSSAFQPGGSRVGLPAAAAVYVLKNDGSTQFTYPL
ncbi:MAG TPA: hypothetical protein VIE65_07525 [Methylobacter sp.]|jgi:hypothetical protein